MNWRQAWYDAVVWWHKKCFTTDLNMTLKFGDTHEFGVIGGVNMSPCKFECCGRRYHFWNMHLSFRFFNLGVYFHLSRWGLWLSAFHVESCGWYKNVKGEPEYDEDYERVNHILWDWAYSPDKGFENLAAEDVILVP